MVRRSGARPGDRVLVTGTIGDAALGLALRTDGAAAQRWELDATMRGHLTSRYLLPQPRSVLAAAVRAHAHAAMDVSDGLAGDLGKLCRASGVAAEIEVACVPLSDAARQALAAEPALIETILTGGDDYEVLCTVAADKLNFVSRGAEARGRAGDRDRSRGRRGGGAFLPSRRQAVGLSRVPRSVISEAGPRYSEIGIRDRSHARHDRARQSQAGLGRHRRAARCGAAPPLPDHRLSARWRAPAHPEIRVRIFRRRGRRRHRHCAQLERARCRRAGAALRRHHGIAADRHRAVRPALCGADRHRADGRTRAGLAWRGRVSRARRAARAHSLHARHRRRPRPSSGSRRSRPTCFWFQLYRLCAQRSRARLRSGQARRSGRRPCARCSRSTSRYAPRARARWQAA